MVGWFKVHRQLRNHWIYEDPIKFKWWITILMEVSYSDSKIALGNNLYMVKAGQSANSLSRWGMLFGVGKKAVLNFFTLLESDGMISKKTIGKGKRSTTLINITNWDTFQGIEETQGTPQGTPKRKRKGHTLKESKEVKERKNLLGERFEKWFKYYGVETSKETAKTLFINLTDEQLQSITLHTPKYVKLTDVRFRKNPYKYLREKIYLDEVIDRRDNKDTKLKPQF